MKNQSPPREAKKQIASPVRVPDDAEGEAGGAGVDPDVSLDAADAHLVELATGDRQGNGLHQRSRKAGFEPALERERTAIRLELDRPLLELDPSTGGCDAHVRTPAIPCPAKVEPYPEIEVRHRVVVPSAFVWIDDSAVRRDEKLDKAADAVCRGDPQAAAAFGVHVDFVVVHLPGRTIDVHPERESTRVVPLSQHGMGEKKKGDREKKNSFHELPGLWFV